MLHMQQIPPHCQKGIDVMKEIYRQYLNNVEECHRLVKANRFSALESEDDILEAITANAHAMYRLRLENDAILNQVLFSKKAETLTPEEVQDLQAFAADLLAYVHQYDAGIAYKIHCLLFEYAKLHDDLDLYIRELYYMGISLFYLSPSASEFGINLNGTTATGYLREAVSFLPKLEEIESNETRTYVIRCLANLFLTDETINGPHHPGKTYDRSKGYLHFRKLFSEIMGVLTSPYYHELLPDFDWDTTIHNIHFNRCFYYLQFHRNDLPNMAEELMESAEYIYKYKQQNQPNNTKNARIDYLYTAARHLAGQAEATDIVDVLLDAVEGADKEDYSLNGVMLNLQLPLYLEYTNKLLTEEQRNSYGERIQNVLDGILLYLKNAPSNAYNNVVNEIVSETIRHYVQNNEPVSKRLFDYLLCCHTPTYIHVQLVAALSRTLFLRMVDTAPQKVVGLLGITDPNEIIARKDILADRVYDCALYHDVGKIMLLNYIEIYNRSLLQEEYTAICLHPQIGAQILNTLDPEEIAFPALYHHSFHDHSNGYPKQLPPCPSEYKLLSDIVSVCDSLEAATDNVGRCYAAPKTFDDIIEELRKGCPSRYSSDVVALFDDKDFFEQVKADLQASRRKTYIELYREPEDDGNE